MHSIQTSAYSDTIVGLDNDTCFTELLEVLARRLDDRWEAQTSWSYDGTSILLLTPATEEVGSSFVVSESPDGLTVDEMKGDCLTQVAHSATMDQVTSIVARHVLRKPTRRGRASARPVAA